MSLSRLINRKLVAMSLLVAMLMFVAVFNIHTDDQQSCLSRSVTSTACEITSCQSASSHGAHCVACELINIGAGNAQNTPAIVISENVITEALVGDIKHAAHPIFPRSFPSRASPI